MEMTSTGAFIALVDGINKKNILIEDINLEEVDDHLDNQEKEAQERYDRIDDEILPEGWKQELPYGWKQSDKQTDSAMTDTSTGASNNEDPTLVECQDEVCPGWPCHQVGAAPTTNKSPRTCP